MRAFHEKRLYQSTLPFHASIARNISFLAHWHNDLEFIYVCEGTLRMGINSETRILKQGDMAFCSSGDIHYYDSRDSDSAILLIIFNPQLIGSPGGWPQEVRLTSPFLDSSAVSASGMDKALLHRMAQIMQSLLAEEQHKLAQHGMLITGLLYELCGMILRYVPCEPADQKKDKRRVVNMKVMQQVLDYLEANYMHAVSLEDAARQAHMSLFHFSRFFKSISGMSYPSYLNSIRISKAEAMILNTDQTMLDIALECGFTNVRTFNRVFKHVRGCTPTELR